MECGRQGMFGNEHASRVWQGGWGKPRDYKRGYSSLLDEYPLCAFCNMLEERGFNEDQNCSC